MSDSESDNDLFTHNATALQNPGTTICAKGPNINVKLSAVGFHNNNTSRMYIPWNTFRPRNAESVCDTQSMIYRRGRDLSPMSCRSVSSSSNFNTRNLHTSCYPSNMSSSKSLYNGRCGSSMSVRTMDSNTSLSANDIAHAFRNGNFNKFDFKIIKAAYNTFMKGRVRKRIEKKRNIRTFLKGFRRMSGGDSGDQASDSSISSDDCRSIQSSRSNFKENMSSYRSLKGNLSSVQSTIKDKTKFKNYTDSFRQQPNRIISSGSRDEQNIQKPARDVFVFGQKDRFKSGFLLPSQRFNHSMAANSYLEKTNKLQKIDEDRRLDANHKHIQKNPNTSVSEEEIFDTTVRERTSFTINRKRNLGVEDCGPTISNKRNKLSSPQKRIPTENAAKATNQKSNDFVFAKPQLPVKKPTMVRNNQKNNVKLRTPKKGKENPGIQIDKRTENCIDTVAAQRLPKENFLPNHKQTEEKILASSNKYTNNFIADPVLETSVGAKIVETQSKNCRNKKNDNLSTKAQLELTQQSTIDMSMRPSFIKRKLFSQKVDLAEKNSSSDSLQADSPQTNIYSKIQKEKNKARKLATQSCLSRDVLGDESNLLDLIHRVVPANQMNVTNKPESTKNCKTNNANNWDVSSVLTTCNDELSDTYTDEEIFTSSIQPQKNSGQDCVVTVEKVQISNNKKPQTNDNKPKPRNVKKSKIISNATESDLQSVQLQECRTNDELKERKENFETKVYKSVKLFWDTDIESEVEATPTKHFDKSKQGNSVPKDVNKSTPKIQRHINTPVSNKRVEAPAIINDKDLQQQITNDRDIRTKETIKTKLQMNKKTNSGNKANEKQRNTTNTKQLLNNTLRAQRKPKVIKCCEEQPKLDKTLENSGETLYRSLRSREVDVSFDNIQTKEIVKTKLQINKKTNSGNKANEKQSTTTNTKQLLNGTLRAQRKPKVIKCCEKLPKLDQTLDNSGETLYKSLRSRDIDVSIDNTNLPKKKKTIKNQNASRVNSASDMSLTLQFKSNHNTQKKNVRNKSPVVRKTRQSDVSFSL